MIFAAYLTKGGKVILGLPAETRIRAVADGVVYYTSRFSYGYENIVWVKHEERWGGLTSGYCHVTPSVIESTKVKKGDIIGIPWKQSGNGNKGTLVHLHFELRNEFQAISIDPRFFDNSLHRYNMIPPTTVKFTIPELPPSTPFEVAHFRRVDVGADNRRLFRSKERIG